MNTSSARLGGGGGGGRARAGRCRELVRLGPSCSVRRRYGAAGFEIWARTLRRCFHHHRRLPMIHLGVRQVTRLRSAATLKP